MAPITLLIVIIFLRNFWLGWWREKPSAANADGDTTDTYATNDYLFNIDANDIFINYDLAEIPTRGKQHAGWGAREAGERNGGGGGGGLFGGGAGSGFDGGGGGGSSYIKLHSRSE